MGASAYDLGNYNQALFTAARSGRFFYYTPDLPADPSGSIFGAHFIPIFFLILPFYTLFPGIGTLLVIQSFALSLGAVPLYLLTARLSSSKSLGLLFVLLYLLSPLVEGVNWLDFHPEAFIPLGFLTALYASESRRWKLYFAGILLALFSLEFTGVIATLFGAVEVFRHRSTLLTFLKSRRFSEPGPIGLFTIAISATWTLAAISVIHIFNPVQTFLFGGNFGWSVLGARSLVTVPAVAILSPQNAILALSFDLFQKLEFFACVFIPFALFCRGGLRVAIPTLPWVLALAMSNLPAYYSFNDQYTAFLAPFLFAAAAYGYVNLRVRLPKTRRSLLSLNIAFISPMLIIALLLSPLVNVPLTQGVVFGNRGIPALSVHEQLASTIASLIPSSASVFTQPDLFPLVSNRPNAFLFPYQTYFPPGTSFNSTVSAFLRASEFIFLDVKTDSQAPTWMFNNPSQWSEFGLYASADGVLLYKQSYQGPLAMFLPVRQTWTAHDLIIGSGTVVTDTSSIQQEVLYHSGSSGNNTVFWETSPTVVPPGNFMVTFRMRTDRQFNGPATTLLAKASRLGLNVVKISDSQGGYNLLFEPVAANSTTVGQVSLAGGNFTAPGYQDYSTRLNVSSNVYLSLIDYQFQGQYGIYVDQVVLTQLPP